MDYLVHHGIKGQKWGVRRYQHEDGSYTEAGKKRRNVGKVIGAVGVGAAGAAAYYGSKVHRIKKIATYNNHGAEQNLVADNTEAPKKEFDSKANARASKGLNQTGEAVNKIRQSRKDQARANAQQKALDDAKNMTDAQLKERTARLNLENNYVNAISQQQVSAGSDNVDRILAYTAAAFGIAASAVSIYGMFKK